MGDTKNLSSTDANIKVQELAKEIGTCMFCTYDGYKLVSRPMSSHHADDDGTIWFLSDKDSNKNKQIAKNKAVELFFASGHDKFLSLHGVAEISYDREKIKELWVPLAKIWFTEGIEDPRISVIKVSFDDGHYWDSKHGRMIQMAKMAAAFVSGTTMDDGIQGELNNGH